MSGTDSPTGFCNSMDECASFIQMPTFANGLSLQQGELMDWMLELDVDRQSFTAPDDTRARSAFHRLRSRSSVRWVGGCICPLTPRVRSDSRRGSRPANLIRWLSSSTASCYSRRKKLLTCVGIY